MGRCVVMGAYNPTPASTGGAVGVVVAPVGLRASTRRGGPPQPATARGLTAWIIHSVILATVGFALYDLYLLVTSVPH